MQSPIKLDSRTALSLSNPKNLLSIEYPLGKSYPGTFTRHDPSHGNFELSSPHPNIVFRGRKFRLLRVHIHTLAEHLVDSDDPSRFEVHLVHVPESGTLDDPKVVIGILYHVSSAPSQHGLEDFIARAPSCATLRSLGLDETKPTHSITPSKLFPLLTDGKTADLENWFHYEGSLTSFTYSEDVSWFVMKSEAAVDASVVKDLEAYAEQRPRPLQPLSRRLVARSFS